MSTRVMRRRRPLVGALGLCLGALVALGGCSTAATAPTGPRTAAPTPISRLNTGAMVLARVDFCSLVPTAAVQDALGGHGRFAKRAWRNGDPAEVEPGVRDVAHEFGCSWSRTGHDASAWLFARSVSPSYAREVLAKTSHRKGCRASDAHFGRPSQRQICTLDDGSHRVRDSGLFGDVWLTCQISAPGDEPVAGVGRRADAWCVQIANATNTSH